MKQLTPLPFLLLSFGAFINSPVLAEVKTVVSWGGNDVVTSNQPLTNPTSFSPSTIITPGSNYDGMLLSGDFSYGNGTTTANVWQIFANNALGGTTSKDWLQLADSSGTVTGTHQALIFVRQADFLDYATTPGGVILNHDTSLQFRARRTGGTPDFTSYRFVVSVGENYYISAPLGNTIGGTAGGDLITLANPAGVQWFNYTPETSVGSSSIGSVAAIVNEGQITGVSGIGLWFNNARTTSGGLNMNITDISFAAIPEPSTYAAIFGLVAAGAVFLRRRRK